MGCAWGARCCRSSLAGKPPSGEIGAASSSGLRAWQRRFGCACLHCAVALPGVAWRRHVWHAVQENVTVVWLRRCKRYWPCEWMLADEQPVSGALCCLFHSCLDCSCQCRGGGPSVWLQYHQCGLLAAAGCMMTACVYKYGSIPLALLLS